ncbi:MAG: hypothetical protein ACO331_02680 [Prochlorothrix sp.]
MPSLFCSASPVPCLCQGLGMIPDRRPKPDRGTVWIARPTPLCNPYEQS